MSSFTKTVKINKIGKMNKLSKTHKCCILCLKSPIKVPGLKLHRFPKTQEKRNVWLNACGLKADEYLPYGKLCSRHFVKSCYNKSGFQLKEDAIPTKQLKRKIIQPFFRLSEDKTLDLTSNNDESTSKNDELTSKNDELTIPNLPSTSKLQTTRTVLSSPSTPELQETPKKQKRFVGELKSPDFATPRRIDSDRIKLIKENRERLFAFCLKAIQKIDENKYNRRG